MEDKNTNVEEQEVLTQEEESLLEKEEIDSQEVIDLQEASDEEVAKKSNKLVVMALVAGVVMALVAFVILDPFAVFSGNATESVPVEDVDNEDVIVEEENLEESETETLLEEVEEDLILDDETNELVEESETETSNSSNASNSNSNTSTSTNNTTTSSSNTTTANTTTSTAHTCTWKTTTEQVLVKAATTETVTYYRDQYRKCNVSSDGRNYTLEWEAYCASNGSISFSVWNTNFGGSYTTKSVVVGQESYTETVTVPAEYKTVSTTTCTVCGATK